MKKVKLGSFIIFHTAFRNKCNSNYHLFSKYSKNESLRIHKREGKGVSIVHYSNYNCSHYPFIDRSIVKRANKHNEEIIDLLRQINNRAEKDV